VDTEGRDSDLLRPNSTDTVLGVEELGKGRVRCETSCKNQPLKWFTNSWGISSVDAEEGEKNSSRIKSHPPRRGRWTHADIFYKADVFSLVLSLEVAVNLMIFTCEYPLETNVKRKMCQHW